MLTKQVVSARDGTINQVEMTPAEEAAFRAEWAANETLTSERAARAQKEQERRVLRETLLEARITASAPDARDLARYAELKSELSP